CRDPVDEDLFERRFHYLEARDARTPHCGVKQLLWIGPGAQLDLCMPAIVVARFDHRACQKPAVAFIVDLDELPAVACLDVAESALQNRMPMVDKADSIAQLLDLVHAMS